MTVRTIQMQQRADTDARWLQYDPILRAAEIGVVSDGTHAGWFKIGDGDTEWSGLAWAGSGLHVAGMADDGPLLKRDAADALSIRGNADADWADITVRNLTVKGVTTTIDSETVAIADNILTLNSDVEGTPPSTVSGIEVERGDEVNARIVFDEGDDAWKAGLAGSEAAISLEGHEHSYATLNDVPTKFTPESHAATHAAGGTDEVTPASIGADVVGAAATVQTNLDTHREDTANPHGVTYEDAGADAAGSADAALESAKIHCWQKAGIIPVSIYPTLHLKPDTDALPNAFTFTRSEPATYYDAVGVLQTAAIDTPRFGYDSSTGERLGLLIDPTSLDICHAAVSEFAFDPTQGTLFVEWIQKAVEADQKTIGLYQDASNRAHISIAATGILSAYARNTSGVVFSLASGVTVEAGQTYRAALSIGGENIFCVNGEGIFTSTSALNISPIQLDIGSLGGITHFLNGSIAHACYFPRALSAEELKRLTS